MVADRTEVGPERDPRSDTPTARGLVLALACGAEFMVVLDASVINVALPAIQRGLDFEITHLSWVINAYALVFAGFLPLGGRLTDLWGPRRTFMVGLAVFVVASAAGGMAFTAGMLVAARAVQALGAALLAPASLAVLTSTFPEGRRRNRAVATWTALASAGGAAGSLMGGVLTQYLTWRATLLINVPIGAVAVAATLRAFPPARHRDGGAGVDMPGTVTPGTANSDQLALVTSTSTAFTAMAATLIAVAVTAVLLPRTSSRAP